MLAGCKDVVRGRAADHDTQRRDDDDDDDYNGSIQHITPCWCPPDSLKTSRAACVVVRLSAHCDVVASRVVFVLFVNNRIWPIRVHSIMSATQSLLQIHEITLSTILSGSDQWHSTYVKILRTNDSERTKSCNFVYEIISVPVLYLYIHIFCELHHIQYSYNMLVVACKMQRCCVLSWTEIPGHRNAM